MSQEIDLSKLGEKIFSEEPKPKFSIQVQFENANVKELFESLLMITTYGMKVKFGDAQGKVELADLNKSKLAMFNQYMNSFGIVLQVNTQNFSPFIDYDALKYNNVDINPNTELRELKFPMIDSGGRVYIISFDFLRDYA